MLKGLKKHRPKSLVAVYVEPRRVEVLRASRMWRKWEIEPTEQHMLIEGESLYDMLTRLSLRPKGRHASALLLFLPRMYYSFHREHYPHSLQDRLEEALTFDWHENLFYENGQTLHFTGLPVPVNQNISVPVFSLQRDVYERFQQALSASSYQTFAVIPSALAYGSFFPVVDESEHTLPLEIIGRLVDATHLEIHRFYNGSLLDSSVIGKNQGNLKLFRESLLCFGQGECQSEAHVHLVCSNGDCTADYIESWNDENLSLRPLSLQSSVLSHWVRYLLNQEQVHSFETQLYLKPWKAPKVIWPVLFAACIYAAFASYQFHSFGLLEKEYKELKWENSQLDTQWKPIEQLQNQIAKFQEDQKTLSAFAVEGYPLLEILTVLSQITPQDTWLNYLSVRKGQLVLRGESKSAIKYLPELSKIEGFADVRFSSPVTRNPSSDQERFNVQLQIDTEKLKKTIEAIPPEDKGEEKLEEEGPEPHIPEATPAAVVKPGGGRPGAEQENVEEEEDTASEDTSSEEEEESVEEEDTSEESDEEQSSDEESEESEESEEESTDDASEEGQ